MTDLNGQKESLGWARKVNLKHRGINIRALKLKTNDFNSILNYHTLIKVNQNIISSNKNI